MPTGGLDFRSIGDADPLDSVVRHREAYKGKGTADPGPSPTPRSTMALRQGHLRESPAQIPHLPHITSTVILPPTPHIHGNPSPTPRSLPDALPSRPRRSYGSAGSKVSIPPLAPWARGLQGLRCHRPSLHMDGLRSALAAWSYTGASRLNDPGIHAKIVVAPHTARRGTQGGSIDPNDRPPSAV